MLEDSGNYVTTVRRDVPYSAMYCRHCVLASPGRPLQICIRSVRVRPIRCFSSGSKGVKLRKFDRSIYFMITSDSEVLSLLLQCL